MSNDAAIHESLMNGSGTILPRVGVGVGVVGVGVGLEDSFQDQSCNLKVGALCSCGAEAHPTVSATFLGLEPIA